MIILTILKRIRKDQYVSFGYRSRKEIHMHSSYLEDLRKEKLTKMNWLWIKTKRNIKRKKGVIF